MWWFQSEDASSLAGILSTSSVTQENLPTRVTNVFSGKSLTVSVSASELVSCKNQIINSPYYLPYIGFMMVLRIWYCFKGTAQVSRFIIFISYVTFWLDRTLYRIEKIDVNGSSPLFMEVPFRSSKKARFSKCYLYFWHIQFRCSKLRGRFSKVSAKFPFVASDKASKNSENASVAFEMLVFER